MVNTGPCPPVATPAAIAVAKGWQKGANVVALDMVVKVVWVRLLKSVGYVALRCLLFCLRLLSSVVCESLERKCKCIQNNNIRGKKKTRNVFPRKSLENRNNTTITRK